MIDLTLKLGEIHDTEHNTGSKIYSQNQLILDCIMPSIPLKHIKYHSDMGHCFSKFCLLFLIGKNRHVLGKRVAIFDWEWGRNWAPSERQKILCSTLKS